MKWPEIPAQVGEWLASHGHGQVQGLHPVGGGCINHGARLSATTGASFFLKTNRQAPVDLFLQEAAGLRALQVPGGPYIPEPFLSGQDFLLMEDLSPSAPILNYWATLGRQLAALHACSSPQFGFPHHNYLGSTPQPNPWTKDGYQFFAESRLLFQARRAAHSGLLSASDADRVEALARRLPELVPSQPASLIHGDLWSGNVICNRTGMPALIDPAVHYGWAEAELGMTALFGGFPAAFYQAYLEARPLQPGWRERFPVYNLYHLLNHLNLFGVGYLAEVIQILRRYA